MPHHNVTCVCTSYYVRVNKNIALNCYYDSRVLLNEKLVFEKLEKFSTLYFKSVGCVLSLHSFILLTLIRHIVVNYFSDLLSILSLIALITTHPRNISA